jgi:uncharacterized protein YjbI with pentapeptide repeats
MDSGIQNPKRSHQQAAPEKPAPEKVAPEKPAPEKPAPEKPAMPNQEKSPESTEATIRVDSADPSVQGDKHKLKLEIDKLGLEVDSLRFKHSFLGRLIETLQIVGPFVAIIALAWTVYTGILQQEQLRRDAESSRLQQAYARLGGQLSSERSSGVAELSALLGADNGKRDGEILNALVDALALDSNPEIRSNILSVFGHLKGKVNKSALDAALQGAVNHQRVKIRSSHLYPFELATIRQEGRGAFSYVAITEDRISPSFQRQWTTDSQQAIVESLGDLRAVLLDLLKAGGHVKDLSGIFCSRCDFSSLNSNFDNVHFEDAILVGTFWHFAEVNHANFDRALLEEADFTGTHLRGTTFGEDQDDFTRKWFVEVNPYLDCCVDFGPHASGGVNLNEDNTKFACSDLQDASFKYFAIMVRMDQDVPSDYSLSEYFDGANVENADLRTVREVVVRPGTKRMPEGRVYREDKIKTSNGVLAVGVADVEDAPRVAPNLGFKDMEGIGALLDLAENADSAKLAGPETTLKVLHQRRNSKRGHAVDCKKLLEDHLRATSTKTTE